MSILMGHIMVSSKFLFFMMIKSEIHLHGMCTETGILNVATIEHHGIAFPCGRATCTFDSEQTLASYLQDAVLEL